MPPTIRLEVEDLVPAGAFYRALFGASEQTASPDGTLRLEASAFDVSLVLIPKPRRAAESQGRGRGNPVPKFAPRGSA
jgi:hypothetical protein